MIYVAMSVGCRTNNSLRCADGMCLPPTVPCDGLKYCNDGSTFAVLCGEFSYCNITATSSVFYDNDLDSVIAHADESRSLEYRLLSVRLFV